MREQLTSLRRVMEAQHIDAYLIPTTDFHGSEYIHDHFKVRAYISGFTGSAGTLLVTRDAAKLWTDGRYFLQAEKELAGSGIDLMKTGEPDVPSVFSYLGSVLQPGQTLAFDGRVMAYQQGQIFSAIYSIVHTEDPAEQIWPDRPEVFPSKIYPLPDTVTGESCASKLGRLLGFLKKRGADYHLITKLEDIAWLFNLRGSDINYTPVFFAYALIIGDKINLYTMSKVSTTLPSNVQLRPYDAIYADLAALPAGSMLLDQEIVSYSLVKALPDTVEIENSDNPVALMRALKTAEIKSTENAHLKVDWPWLTSSTG
ncbi:MAG: aminopeptidase P family N-terminal domain-containing protein [Emergencia sp.]